jgi:hypothetical protein
VSQKKHYLVLATAALLGAFLATGLAIKLTGAASGPGQFIIACPPSHIRAADPIVAPETFPSSHEHQFFANNSTDENSTVASMEAAGTTCADKGDTAGYWEPTLCRNSAPYPSTGCQTVIQPLTMFAYYHGRASTQKPPEGLRMVAGGELDPGHTFWDCFNTNGSFSSPPLCSGAKNYLVVRVRFPDCWDGVHLDSADHRSHMSYDKGGKCDAAHPVLIPDINFFTRFPAGLDPSGLSFSDGSTIEHADFFQTWRQSELQRLMQTCINAEKTCGQVKGS